ncbi:MAG: hypothetical protein V3S01_09495, partial [Dehalococcoidia bacterium]
RNLSSVEGRAAGARADAVRRAGSIEDLQEQFPGRAPGGTGATGNLGLADHLNMNDEQGEQANLLAALSGNAAPTTDVDLESLVSGKGDRLAAGQVRAPSTPVTEEGGAEGQVVGSGSGTNADIEGQKTLLGLQELRDNVRKGSAEADEAEITARESDPDTAARTSLRLGRLGRRRDVEIAASDGPGQEQTTQFGTSTPRQTGNITAIDTGSTQLGEQAEQFADPNFDAVVEGLGKQLRAGVNPDGSPANSQVVSALIFGDTSRARNASIAERESAQQIADMAEIVAKITGASKEQMNQIFFETWSKRQDSLDNAVSAATEATRVGRVSPLSFSSPAQEITDAAGAAAANRDNPPQPVPFAPSALQSGLDLGAPAPGTPDPQGAGQQLLQAGHPTGIYEVDGVMYAWDGTTATPVGG